MIGTYEQCRYFIKDGDIIYIKKGFNLVNKIVQFVTNSPYYHVGIAFYMEKWYDWEKIDVTWGN